MQPVDSLPRLFVHVLSSVKILMSVMVLHLSACASLSGHFPNGDDLADSSVTAAKDPMTWAPLALASVVVLANADQRISSWSHEHEPVFSNDENAHRFADDARSTLEVIALGTTLFASTEHHPDLTWQNKFENLLGLWLVKRSAAGATSTLKGWTHRKRPNEYDDRSFPSGHATTAFAYAAEASRNLDDYDLSPTSLFWSKAGVYALAGGVAWARTENGAHYFSDVLVGAGLGNSIAEWLYGAFRQAHRRHANINVIVSPDITMIQIDTTF